MSVTLDQAEAVKLRAWKVASEFGTVVGAGITKVGDDFAVCVNFRDDPELSPPVEIDGVPVVYRTVGVIRPL